MEIDKSKIALVTTVSNWDLYKKTQRFFPEDLNYFVIDGTTGFYGIRSILFFLERLKKYDFDWLIMADEDVIFTNPEEVFDLINYMRENSFTASGVRDGGTLPWRNKNPHVLNTFFCVLNLKEIYSIYNKDEMLSNQFIIINEFKNVDLSFLKFSNYDENSLFEPYYCFFLWLIRRGKKINYLNASNPFEEDYATTRVLNHSGKELLYHTWFARFYGKNDFHTKRISKIIDKGTRTTGVKTHILLRNRLFVIKVFIYTISRRIIRLSENLKK